ncbi:MAG: thiamine diphosphokinase [Puniceicoccales bacterium]|nr:thiamine diphosphokinase [Puniceicoccales bacterium]
MNGNLPDQWVFKGLGLPLIAADGAANSLAARNIVPDMIIGDLDSVKNELLQKGKFLKNDDQNSSDFQKALKYLETENLMPTIILGLNGGYIDHILNNINIFLRTKSIFYDEQIIGLGIDNHQTLNLKIGTKLSLFGIPSCCVSTKGLKWDLDKKELTFPGFNSCFNRTNSENVAIHIIKGTALLLLYTSLIVDAGLN